uniref:Uncharacterized protein ycf33 n=1 Tax=Leersia perrieri TaxID=77586 RepID=A0A0D9X1B2_9ORYZ
MNHLSLLHLPLISPIHLHRRHGSTTTTIPQAHLPHHPQTNHPQPLLAVKSPPAEPEPVTAAAGGGRTCGLPTWALIGGITVGVAVVVALAGPAAALGPEGPLVEEFWDNMRRYALYVVTVSTGFAYTLLEPIVELLKNPVTALLIVAVLAGGGFLVSQVLNAMVGNSDFIYSYSQ